MDSPSTSAAKSSFICQHPAVSYFALTFTASWTAAVLVTAPRLLQGAPLLKLTGILMFPAMLVGPSFSGIFPTLCFDVHQALQSLFAHILRFLLPLRCSCT